MPIHSVGRAQTARETGNTRRATGDSIITAHARYLQMRYQTQIPPFLTLQWPPPPTQKVLHLAMIRGKKIQYGPIDEDMVRLTLRGKVKDILHQKTPVELRDIFRLDNTRHKVILVEGAPGSGKSTLAWHICQKWGAEELFQNFQTVVFVQLRDPAIQLARRVEDIFPAESKFQAEKVVTKFQACYGQDLLFVMDGWDELPLNLHTNSIFHRLVAFPESINLSLSTVVITSRPIASGNLHRTISSRVEILGFAPTEIEDYFKEALGGDSRAVEKLQEQLSERPIIQASCYLPLNAAIVTHLFLAQNQSLPVTLHGVFHLLVLGCLKRHSAKQEQGTQHISSFDKLPLDLQESFMNICILAYHGVIDNRATFPAECLEPLGLPKNMETLGLIQGIQSFIFLDSSVSYNFLHLSVQELLASFYISKLPGNEQVNVFEKLFGQPRFAAVFQFYAAFTKLETKGIRKIVGDIAKNKERSQLVYLLHGLYEAQDLSLCQFVGSQLGGELNLDATTLSPVDSLTVGYFISCICRTGSGKFKASLSTCLLDDYRINFLAKELCTRDVGVSDSFELHLK